MLGSFLLRALLMALGYVYPAYQCFKAVEKNQPNRDHLLFWCHYWILVALLTVCERLGDLFFCWLPLYGEAKVAFFIFLWHPRTKGTTYVYNSFLRPYLKLHEKEMDAALTEFQSRARNIALQFWQKGATYGQTRLLEILQYISSQSKSNKQ